MHHPAVDYGFGPGWATRPSARRTTTPPGVPRPRPAPSTAATPAPAASPVPTVPISSDRDRAEPVGTPLLRLTPPPGDTPTAPTTLDTLDDAAVLQFVDSVARYWHADWEREQQAEPTAMPQCGTLLPAGRWPCHPAFCRATPRTSVPLFRTSRNWLVKDAYTRPTTTSSYSSVTRRRRRRRLTSLARWGELLACCRTSLFASTFPCSCALGSCKLAIRRLLATWAPRAHCAC